MCVNYYKLGIFNLFSLVVFFFGLVVKDGWVVIIDINIIILFYFYFIILLDYIDFSLFYCGCVF